MKCPKCLHENPDDTRFCGNCGEALDPSNGASLTKTLITPKASLQEGSIVGGRYTIIEELGRGGMGVVFKAEDTMLRRTVALKFLPPELTHIPEVKERFMREAQAAAALDHSNICTVYEFGEADGANFISMAYIEGQSIRKMIEKGPLGLEEAMRIAEQVAGGLQAAHQKGIVHRDIKSANILVTERGQAKIMDFGLARTAEKTLLTKEGTTMGTVAYMSPEQARGEEVDQRTDIWSFGVVLYEMLTGQLPFKGENEQAIVYSIRKDKPKLITEYNAEISPSIEQVVDKALEKDAGKRYQQVDELLDDLKSISAGIVPEEIKVRLRKEKLRKRRKAIVYAGGVGSVVLAAVLILLFFPGRTEAIDTIAVLPLQNLTGDAEQEYFADGATDELIGQLSQIGGLRRVISRTTIMRFKDTDKSLPDIARELKVDAVVEGTVYQVGENVRIRVQLIAALPEERNLWARTFERAGTDVLMMYGEIARTIAGEIHVKLTEDEEARFSRSRPVDPDAYAACIKGMSHWYKLTPPDLQTALQYFNSALEKDPDYALAHTGVALVWVGFQQMGVVPPGQAAPKAKEAVHKALELDDTLAEVHYALALIKTWSDWDWEGGEAAFKRALEINPNYPDARVYYSHLLAYLGRPEEAFEQGERALELDPLNSLFMSVYGITLGMFGRDDDSIMLAHRALETSPNDPPAHNLLWETLHEQGQYEEALAEAQAFFIGLGLDPISEVLEKSYQSDGYSGAMRSAAEILESISQETHVSPWFISTVYATAGEKEKVFEWLEKGYEIREPNMPYLRGAGVITNLIHDDPRFHGLLQRMKLPPMDEK